MSTAGYFQKPAQPAMKVTRCSAIAERPHCRVRYSFRQKQKTGTGRQYFTDIIGLSSTTIIKSAWKVSNSVKKCKIRAIMTFKVIQGHHGQYQWKARTVCDFLLVINSNW